MHITSFNSTNFNNINIDQPNMPGLQIVPIEKEPSHHLVWSSGSFRVFDVAILPGQTSLFHEHTKDSVIVCIDGADVPSRKPGDVEFVERAPIPSRDVYYRGYGANSFVHQVKNCSANTFRTLDIEFPKPKSTLRPLSELPSNLNVIINNERTRTSKFSLAPGKATETIDCTGAFLLTSFDDGTLSIESDQQSSPSQVKVVPGWIDIQETSQKISIANTGKQIIELVIIEAK